MLLVINASVYKKSLWELKHILY